MGQKKTIIKENETKDNLFTVQCVQCIGETEHLVLSSIDQHHSEFDVEEEWSAEFRAHFQIIKCQGCKRISFRTLTWSSEALDYESADNGEMEYLYPKRSLNAITPTHLFNVPASLRRIYIELIDCFNNESPTLCAAGLRALVEGICSEQGINDGPVQNNRGAIERRSDLRGKIAGLQEKLLLTESTAKTLHEHRFLGNEAVHQLARPSEYELRLAIDIVVHVLEQLYELPEKAEELRRETARRKK